MGILLWIIKNTQTSYENERVAASDTKTLYSKARIAVLNIKQPIAMIDGHHQMIKQHHKMQAAP